MANKKDVKSHSDDTVVEVHFPEKISIELVQANELRHYEIFTWLTSILATISSGFWVAYITVAPRSNQLLWMAIVSSLVLVFSFIIAIYYRKKVYQKSLIKSTTLKGFENRSN